MEALPDRVRCHFSYPNDDYGESEIALVREAGFLSARTIDLGWNGVKTNPYRRKITGVTDEVSVDILSAQVCGITSYLRYLWSGSLTGKHRTVYPHPDGARGGASANA